MTDKIVVLSTCGSADEARKIARILVEANLAACVSILPQVQSIYRWKDKVEDASEWLLVIKSRRELLENVTEEIRKVHSYDVPEVLAIPVVDGLPEYLDWIDAATRPALPPPPEST